MVLGEQAIEMVKHHFPRPLALDPASLTGYPRTALGSLPGGDPHEPVSAQLIFADRWESGNQQKRIISEKSRP
jgi:hypothetical protein